MNASKRRRVGLGVTLMVAASLSLPAAAHADLTVDTTEITPVDGNCSPPPCTLPEAIDLANLFPNSHAVIDFQAGLSGTITLTGGDLEITDPVLAIEGPGAGVLTIAGSGDRIFNLQTVNAATTISGLTLSGGTTGADGGAIRVNQADLTLIGTAVTGNNADDGGGIFGFDSDLVVRNSTLSGNVAGGSGGAIFSQQSRLTVENSTISGNQAPNTTNGTGGGINASENFSIDETTITDSTVANNTAGTGGGGVIIFTGALGPDGTLANTIVADNSAPFPGTDVQGPLDAAFSLVEVGTVSATVPGSNILGQDPQLGALVSNGGPTLTRRPAAGSPVIDKGSTSATTDQRGRARPFDVPHLGNSSTAGADGADIGAVELTGPEAGVKKCGGKAATIIGTKRKVNGTNGADVIVGTGGANLIKGKGGKDVICGLGGPDRLIGGGGRDTLIGGPGGDTLRGGPGRDKLKGGPGRDTQVQ